jgi:hypothetical protein
MYSLKPLQKGTKIESEATTVYKEILGKLKVIKMEFVYVNNVIVNGVNFYSKEKNFDFFNGKFLLENVLIDSAHNFDTTRVLFCKQAAFTVDSFFSYNNDRREISVRDVTFLGKQRSLLFNEISIDRFASDSGKGASFLNAKVLTLNGINTDAVVKNKNIIVDSIICDQIMVYEIPAAKLKTTKIKIVKSNDSTGFRNVYGVYMRYLNFPKVTFVPLANSKYKVGNLAIKINDVQSGQIINLQQQPMNYTKEMEVALSSLSVISDDGLYNFSFKDILVNSLQKQLKINSFDIIPFASERQFANQFNFQKDRYDVSLSGIFLKNIDMNTLLEKKLVASDLVINNLSANIYRDLHKPLEKENKVGNYPSQVLIAMDHEVNVSKATINSANIQYKESEAMTNETGIINFSDTKMTISNVTNIPAEIQKNNTLTISFASKVLGVIPLNGNFKFILNSNDGDFTTTGHVGGFNALELNKVSVPMTLIKINQGTINSIDFNLKGNNTSARGDFVMKYNDLKVDILKRDKTTKEIKKRGFLSMAANIILVNDNPGKQGLRKVNPVFERNIYKSFFNLVWKTIFTGMKKTVGIP